MESTRRQNPYAPLVVPLALALGFLYVHWMGYSSEDPEPLHRTFAFFFEPNFGTVGAALGVSFWALYAVRFNLRRRAAVPSTAAFASLARDLRGRLVLEGDEPTLGELPRLAQALGRTRTAEDQMPHLVGELGAFLGEAVRLERGARWQRAEDPELGPFAYQASALELESPDGQPPVRLNVFAVALRAVHDPAELARFLQELDELPSAAPRA